MTHCEKLEFLLNTFPNKLKFLAHDTKPDWGKMTVQQMVEHMSESVRNASGKLHYEVLTPEEKLPIYRDFMLSDKSFKPETINPIMPAIPLPAKQENLSGSIAELELELTDFVNAFKEDPYNKITNPIFGDLNFEQWTHLLYKHAIHHLKQFGVII
jgi:hypothetical protein